MSLERTAAKASFNITRSLTPTTPTTGPHALLPLPLSPALLSLPSRWLLLVPSQPVLVNQNTHHGNNQHYRAPTKTTP